MFFMDDSYLDGKDFNREYTQLNKDIILKNNFTSQFELFSQIASYQYISENYTITLYPNFIGNSILCKEWTVEVLDSKSVVIGTKNVNTIYDFNNYIKTLNIEFKLTA